MHPREHAARRARARARRRRRGRRARPRRGTRRRATEGVSVALVEQPYRVAGRRSPAPAPQLDAAWIAVVERLAARELAGLPLVVGGRSSGARVACRTAAAAGAAGVLCLAFPLQPARRSGPRAPSRLPELEAVAVPVLVVQGRRDPFGIPPGAQGRTVVEVDGTHGLRANADAVGAAAVCFHPPSPPPAPPPPPPPPPVRVGAPAARTLSRGLAGSRGVQDHTPMSGAVA